MSRHKLMDKLTPEQEARLIQLACSDDPPTWRALATRFNVSMSWVSELITKGSVSNRVAARSSSQQAVA